MRTSRLLLCAVLAVVAVAAQSQSHHCQSHHCPMANVPMVMQAALAMWMATTARITPLIRHGVRAISAMMTSQLLQCAVLAVVAVAAQSQSHHCPMANVPMVMQAALAMWMATTARITPLIRHGVRAISAMMTSPLLQCAALAAVVVLLQHNRSRQCRHRALTATQAATVMLMVTTAFNTLPIRNGAWATLAMMTSLLLQCVAFVVAAQLCRIGFIERSCRPGTG